MMQARRLRVTSVGHGMVLAGLALLVTLLILGWIIRPTPTAFPPGIERHNPGVYGGWVPTAHPLGVYPTVPFTNHDLLEWLLMGLSRTLTGPLLACALAVLLGGLWGTWAAFTEGSSERVLQAGALLLEAVPRIVVFALFLRVVRDLSAKGGTNVELSIVHVTVAFALFQIPAIALSFRNHVRSIVREGYIEGLISLGFPRRTIVLRDLFVRECGPLARLQYVARVTELIALETAVSYAIGGSGDRTVGWVLRYCWGTCPWGFVLLLCGCLAIYLLTLSALARARAQIGRRVADPGDDGLKNVTQAAVP